MEKKAIEREPATEWTSVAVLLTCHDRRETTLACLRRVDEQEAGDSLVDLEIFLVDDGSTDGTADAVRTAFPKVRVIPGSGDLFWCGGMRLAFATALDAPKAFDYFLWLNDDTAVFPGALERLVSTHRRLSSEGREHSIVVGSCVDPATGRQSYGGFRRVSLLPFLRVIPPEEEPVPAATMHGNLVLIPSSVATRVGNLDPDLQHIRGDVDYGLRARSAGCEVWVAPGFLAACEANPIGRWRNLGLPLRDRLHALSEPKYALKEKILVTRRHFGSLWFLSPLALYTYIVLSHVAHRLGRPLRRLLAGPGG